jgi:hypothetical protein
MLFYQHVGLFEPPFARFAGQHLAFTRPTITLFALSGWGMLAPGPTSAEKSLSWAACTPISRASALQRCRFSCLTKARDIVINYLPFDGFLSHTLFSRVSGLNC